MVFLFKILGFNIGIAQEVESSFNYLNYSIKDGLPSVETYDVFNDSKGFTWIGTDNGAVKYNGVEFITYTTNDGLTDNTIFRIKEDQFNRIWFLTYNKRLCYLENGVFKEYKFNAIIANELGNLHQGITFTDISISENKTVRLLLLNSGVLEIDSNGMVKPNNLEVDYLLKPSLPLDIDLPTEAIYRCGNLKIFSKYIYRQAGYKKLQVNVLDSTYYMSFTDKMVIWDVEKNQSKKTLIKNVTVTGISKDFEGGIWLSTLRNGIYYIPNISISKYNLPVVKNKVIHALIEQNETLVLCLDVDNYYVNRNKSDLKLTKYPDVISKEKLNLEKFKKGIKLENPIYFKYQLNTVTSLACYNAQYQILGLDYFGLSFHTNNSSDFYNSIPKGILPKYVTNLDKTWKVYKNRKFASTLNYEHNLTLIDDFKDRILRIFIDENHTVWVSTLFGLKQLTAPPFKVKTGPINATLDGVRIQDINQTNDGTMLFGTKTKGIYFMKEDSIFNLTLSNGLLSNRVQTILYDALENRIFVSSNLGISIIHQNENEWKIYKTISHLDGLKSTTISAMHLDDEHLYFASNDALQQIPFASLNQNLPPPKIIIKNFLANQKSIHTTSPIILNHDSNTIVVNYNSISYKSQDQIKYSYRLSPLQKKWSLTSNPNVSFNSLPPGNYRFEVKALNLEGSASPIAAISFKIKQAYWMTIWFKTILFFAFLGLTYFLTSKVVTYYKKQAQIQTNLKELQIMSMQSKMNPHFIFNSLNSIQNYILKNEKEKANDYLLEFSKLIRIILQNSNQPSISLQNEMDTINLYVELEQKRLRKPFEYTVNIDSKINQKNCLIPSLLVQPYIENAIWHGKIYDNPKGLISIEIKKEINTILFVIRDNGIGIKNAQKSKVTADNHESLGSEISRKRIQILGELNSNLSKVQIEDIDTRAELFVGTQITFSIPYILKDQP